VISALSLLLLFQLVGEALVRALALPVPGPVIGMALLFVFLALRGGASDPLRETSQKLLQHLSLLFVPAGTGIMLHLNRIADEWLALLLSIVVSTFVTLAVTALVMRCCQRREPAEDGA
jgi:holin-like protein